MKRFWTLVLAVSFGVNLGLLYTVLTREKAGPEQGPGVLEPPPPGHFEALLDEHLHRMADSLGLDDEQRSAIAVLHGRLLPGISEEHRGMRGLRREIAVHFEGAEFDAAEFRALARRLSDAQVRLDALVTEAMLGEASVLTLEQRWKYAREMPWGRRGAPPDRHPSGEED